MEIDTKAARKASSFPRKASPKNAGSKVPVAMSDFQRAMQALDDVLAISTKEEENEDAESRDDMEVERTGYDKENNPDDDSNNCRKAFLLQVHKSLKERLHQIAEPISDEVFHKKARGPAIQEQIDEEKWQEKQVIAKEEAEFEKKRKEQQKLEEMHKVEFNTSYDDKELLDEDALKKAKDLRLQVRNQVSEIMRQKQKILERAVGLAQREISLLTEDILLHDTRPAKEVSPELQQANVTRRQQLQQMKSTLKELTESLYQTVDEQIPQSMSDLKETVETIKTSLERNEQPESLSQIEQTIISRSNEGQSWPDLVEEEEEENLDGLGNFSKIDSPLFILANFLCKY